MCAAIHKAHFSANAVSVNEQLCLIAEPSLMSQAAQSSSWWVPGGQKLWIVAVASWQPGSEHPWPSHLPQSPSLISVVLEISEQDFTDFRTRWASTGGILVHARRDPWIVGKHNCAQAQVALKVLLAPSCSWCLLPWDNPFPAGLGRGLRLCPPNSCSAEAYLYIKQGPVGV